MLHVDLEEEQDLHKERLWFQGLDLEIFAVFFSGEKNHLHGTMVQKAAFFWGEGYMSSLKLTAKRT